MPSLSRARSVAATRQPPPSNQRYAWEIGSHTIRSIRAGGRKPARAASRVGATDHWMAAPLPPFDRNLEAAAEEGEREKKKAVLDWRCGRRSHPE